MDKMNRIKLLALIILAVLAGCASMHQSSTSASWERFHSEIIAQRDAGKLTPLQAQLDLWSKYRELFGEDPTMNGFYAYSVKLMSSVEAGKMSLEDAQALIDARESEISTRKVAEMKRDQSYDAYGNPP
jgi:uncharacterized protein YceK